ncbi:MAG: hypothetical protein MUC91_02810 [Verrucomicrobia bacterium]|nr:hypothetical protein [Verrucomicrobiota bacterium]
MTKADGLASDDLHGSDLPVSSNGLLPWAGRMISWQDFREGGMINKSIERDARLNQTLGFGEASFILSGKILRQPATAGS